MICGIVETDKDTEEKLNLFYNLHRESQINLTSIKEKDDFYLKHYLDSIYYFYKYNAPVSPLADIGSGGGFPGIVISIFYPEIKVALIESIGKKCRFLEEACNKLGLKNTEVLNIRSEDIKDRTFNTITARGVASVKDLIKNTLNLSRKGTKWIMYKGEKLGDELEDAKNLLSREGMKIENEIRIEKPFTRTYIIISR